MENIELIVKKFCKLNGFESFEFHSVWNEYKAYVLFNESDKESIIGYPFFAILKEGKIRIATDSEVFSILGLDN